MWGVGAVCALAGAFCYSELGVNFPSSGGEYVYLTQAYGPTWGFMTGWVSFFAGFSAPIAAAALAFSDYLGHFSSVFHLENSHHLIGSGALEFKFGIPQTTACTVIALFTIVNCLGVRLTARVQNVLTFIKVMVIFAFLAAGFAFGNGSWDNFAHAAVRTSTTPLYAQFIVSLLLVYFGYSGWNAATYIAEELKQPARTLPYSLAFGTLLVGALYLGLNVLFIYAMPLETMKSVVAVGALAATHLFGPAVAGAFARAMALSLLATMNARSNHRPARLLCHGEERSLLRGRGQGPSALAYAGYCDRLAGPVRDADDARPFVDLLLYIGFLLNFFALLSVASLFKFRRRPGWKKLGVVSFAYPLVPVFFILVGVGMTIFSITYKPVTAAIAILTVAAGAAIYHFRIKRRTA